MLLCAIPQSLPQTTEGLPDDWYQGSTSFADGLSVIDVKSGDSYPFYIFDPEVETLDITHITLSSDNILVSFINKKDSALWLIRTNLISLEE